MKRMRKVVLGTVLAGLGLVVSGMDYRVPLYTAGFTMCANGVMDPDASAFLKASKNLALTSDATLADFRELDYLGTLQGSWFGTSAQVPACCAYQIEYHETAGVLDKIVLAIPNNGTFTKAVVVQLTQTATGVVSACPLFARYHNGAENCLKGNFFSLAADGTVTALETAATLASSATANGVGVYGFTATKMVPAGRAKRMFADCTLDDLREHFFSGLAMGEGATFAAPMEGVAVEVVEDAEGRATVIRVDMQTIGETNQVARVELTNGDGGVWARNVSSVPAGAPSDAGVGVFALAATETRVTAQGTGFLTTTDRLLWRKGTLDNVYAVGAWHHGSWVGRSQTVPGFHLRRGSGVGSTLEFESRSSMGTQFRSATVVLTEREDGVWGRVARFAYGDGAWDGPVSYLNGGTAVAVATSPDTAAYGIAGLQGRVLPPLTLALEPGANELDAAVTAACVRVTSAAPATLALATSPQVDLWDFTDAAAPVTLVTPFTNVSFTAGRELAFAADAAPVNCRLSVVEGNTLTLPSLAVLESCGLHARGKVKFTGGDLSSFPKDLATVEEIELAGTHVVTGGSQAYSDTSKASDGFVWNNAGRLVLSGRTTFAGGRNLTTTTSAAGAIVVTNGADVVFGERITLAAQNVKGSRARLELCGGRLTGGWIYALAANSVTEIAIADGEMTTAVTPWVGYTPSKKVNVSQTGGVFAPTSLQPLTENNTYDGTKSTYTLFGGVFVPPAGWGTKFPWLDIVVPANGDATLRLDNEALIPSTLTLNGTLRLQGGAGSLTLATLAGTGALVVASGEVRLATAAHALETHPFTVAAGTTYVKADATDLDLIGATLAGSLAFPQGGTITLPFNGSISGALTAGAGTTLAFTFDAGMDLTRETSFFTAAGGITLANEVKVPTPDGTVAVVSADRTRLVLVPADRVPAVAVWTGGGNLAYAADPANWSCRNAAGEAMPGTVPYAPTKIVVPGPTTTFSVDAASSIAWSEIEFPDELALAADCDWRRLGASAPLPRVIDLRGHRLQVAHLGAGTVADGAAAYVTDTSTGAPGELYLELGAGTVYANPGRDLRGNLRFVQAGAGTYQDALAGKTYTGGTRLEGGTYSCVSGTSGTGAIVVASNATWVIDASATKGFGSAPVYELAGGTLASATTFDAGWAGLAKVSLTADSTLDCMRDFGLIGLGFGETTLDLAGHTLTIPIGGSGRNLWFDNVTVTRGTICVPSGGWFNFDKTGVRAGETDFDLNCALNVQVPVLVHDLTMRYGRGQYAKGAGVISISGTYTPVVDYMHNFRMLNGSTINLNPRSDVVNLVNSAQSQYVMTFASDAVITVDVHSRTLGDDEQLLAWSTPPDASVRFVPDAASRSAGVRLWVRDDGLYASRGGFIIYGR